MSLVAYSMCRPFYFALVYFIKMWGLIGLFIGETDEYTPEDNTLKWFHLIHCGTSSITHRLDTAKQHPYSTKQLRKTKKEMLVLPQTFHFQDSPVLIGEMDSSGSLNAHSLLHLSEQIRAKAVFQTQQAQFMTWQFETEYRGSDFTAAVTMANPDVLRESVILVAHFLQSVCSGLVLGGELVYHRGRHEEGGILTLAGQYSGIIYIYTLYNIYIGT
ncbi:unnamed protein product [Oncorhynchus mykiss]|uniref:Uncharacterized protein n=1 Tax=Oncorhynchus mykiss TaxID=8022 RepID=A0A060YXA6_ONCMY|nr:unnamed protein product [Oncorhynchus mykiss]